ncbi:hypothetical protein NPIL_128161 [Nephila pilipes]|uniref:Uncharacterized protein n=1 Tax=Nephila pilipes TaxID=299642 RepID=A0A8X6ID74_NEPPI|nr:hypothetical protein NPIL_128161 [Nephila pilipes]
MQKDDDELRPHMKKRFVKNLHKLLRLYEDQQLLKNRSQGKAMNYMQLAKASSHILTSGSLAGDLCMRHVSILLHLAHNPGNRK